MRTFCVIDLSLTPSCTVVLVHFMHVQGCQMTSTHNKNINTQYFNHVKQNYTYPDDVRIINQLQYTSMCIVIDILCQIWRFVLPGQDTLPNSHIRPPSYSYFLLGEICGSHNFHRVKNTQNTLHLRGPLFFCFISKFPLGRRKERRADNPDASLGP